MAIYLAPVALQVGERQRDDTLGPHSLTGRSVTRRPPHVPRDVQHASMADNGPVHYNYNRCIISEAYGKCGQVIIEKTSTPHQMEYFTN